MRYRASKRLEINRIVKQFHIPLWRTLAQIGTPSTTFYRWYDRYVEHGQGAKTAHHAAKPAQHHV